MNHNSAFFIFQSVLSYSSQLALLVPLWIGYQRRHLLKPEHKAVFWCCVMWAILTVVGEILFAAKRHNLFVWNIVTVLETLLLGYAFYLALNSRIIRSFIRIAAGLFIVTATADFFFISGLEATTIYTVALESILLITVVLLYFERSLHELRTTPLEQHPMFVIGIGVIVYFAGTTMVFLLKDSVRGIQMVMMMMVNSVLSFVLNLVIARAFWLVGRKPVSLLPHLSTHTAEVA
ncbi:hypothetical protein J0X19_19755 [Hymenobacter sp. BT186]|uniref:Uncharacterized protein n=1 Tax=Hymenobacter telluris TaxID=2816474 RepID=A0A939JFA1_9BACT|nr:hypothetical protein [Hymenobacter telluris]MBO0360207.1 hypothetical protein [Hymenobacter telluris]MBW3376234.1 hypothetical protein [Hymenobacter norwichensis]